MFSISGFVIYFFLFWEWGGEKGEEMIVFFCKYVLDILMFIRGNRME